MENDSYGPLGDPNRGMMLKGAPIEYKLASKKVNGQWKISTVRYCCPWYGLVAGTEKY